MCKNGLTVGMYHSELVLCCLYALAVGRMDSVAARTHSVCHSLCSASAVSDRTLNECCSFCHHHHHCHHHQPLHSIDQSNHWSQTVRMQVPIPSKSDEFSSFILPHYLWRSLSSFRLPACTNVVIKQKHQPFTYTTSYVIVVQ